MRKISCHYIYPIIVLFIVLVIPGLASAQVKSFSLNQVLSFPYPTDLIASPTGSRIAWVLNEKGVRNIWEAEGPTFSPRQLTHYTSDDGQELTSLTFSPDGNYLVFVRGGDHDANWKVTLQPDPASSPEQPHLQIISINIASGSTTVLGQGDYPAVSRFDNRVAFIKSSDHKVWWAPIDGSKKATPLFFDEGQISDMQWSPDGTALAFVSDRGDHSFVGVFRSEKDPIIYLSPSTNHDFYPRWSPDGTQIVYVRTPGTGGAPPEDPMNPHPRPWSIWIAGAQSGIAHKIWQSPATLHGSYPETAGGANLHWGSGGQIVFLADLDGWPHLYEIPSVGGKPQILTVGTYMVEDVAESPDDRYLIYNANTGETNGDSDRRHLYRISFSGSHPEPLTAGTDIEWSPVISGDGHSIAFIRAGALQPPLVTVQSSSGGNARAIDADQVPADFPTGSLIVPKQVTFQSDNFTIHGQLFERSGGGKKPAIIFVHGGPPRQMLLGWHYMHYYANAYAMNQYLASQGYLVLSVNYRLGIGYGFDFHHPEDAGPAGASEYRDIVNAARYLQRRDDVDKSRIGIWGGSYGGYLTALALARNSDIFKAGVDMHGVHDWSTLVSKYILPTYSGYEHLDTDDILKTAWESSPDADIDHWKSPVLLIQGDNDHNVPFHQTVDLEARLKKNHIPNRVVVIPDEIHEFLRFSSWLKAYNAGADFFNQYLKK